MDEFIHIPRDWLTPKVLADPQMLKMILHIASEISSNGYCEISSGTVQMMFGVSRQKFREFLKKTKSQPTNNQVATNITFKNQAFAPIEQPTNNQVATKSQPTTKRKQSKKFIPPTDNDVTRYVTEKGYHFDPKQFVPFYQSKGWMVGKNPMKDWKAACRTWELEWKKKYGERFYYQIYKPTVSNQADRYARIMDAAATILQQPDNVDAYFNDKGRHS